MNLLLAQVLAENQVRQKMSLDDWRAVNPNGYMELQRQAEENVISMYASFNSGGGGGGAHHGHHSNNNNSYPKNMRGNNRHNSRNASLPPPPPILTIPPPLNIPMDARGGGGRKRPLDSGFDGPPHYQPPPAYNRGGPRQGGAPSLSVPGMYF